MVWGESKGSEIWVSGANPDFMPAKTLDWSQCWNVTVSTFVAFTTETRKTKHAVQHIFIREINTDPKTEIPWKCVENLYSRECLCFLLDADENKLCPRSELAGGFVAVLAWHIAHIHIPSFPARLLVDVTRPPVVQSRAEQACICLQKNTQNVAVISSWGSGPGSSSPWVSFDFMRSFSLFRDSSGSLVLSCLYIAQFV